MSVEAIDLVQSAQVASCSNICASVGLGFDPTRYDYAWCKSYISAYGSALSTLTKGANTAVFGNTGAAGLGCQIYAPDRKQFGAWTEYADPVALDKSYWGKTGRICRFGKVEDL